MGTRVKVVVLAVSSWMLTGCCGAFKDGVRAWATGEAYKGAVGKVQADTELDDTSRRIELMGLSGLQCLLDEDEGKSSAATPTHACKCSRPTDAAAQLSDCTQWASSL